MIDNYFVVVRPVQRLDHRDSMSRFYFFDSGDRESIERALRQAQGDADRGGRIRDDTNRMFGTRRTPVAVWKPVFCSSVDPIPVVGESSGRLTIV